MDNLTQSSPFMPPIRTIIVFGDLTYNFQSDLRQLIHVKGNASLTDFFARVSFAFRHEFASLPQLEQEWMPRFTEIADLVENIDRTEGAPALRFALLCVYQIGRFIGHFGKPESSYPAPENTHILGLCTGSFATAAISTSQNIAELIPAGVEAVIQALQTGLLSLRLQRDLERAQSSIRKSWSAIIALSEQHAADLIEKHAVVKAIPRRHRPFISSVSPNNVTISGPPSQVEDFVGSEALKAHFLPIETPFHAAHLCELGETSEAIGKPLQGSFRVQKLRIPVINPSSGEIVSEGSFEDLLRQAVDTTLCQQVRWDKILLALTDLVLQSEAYFGCTIVSCASNTNTLLSSTLGSIKNINLSISNALSANVDVAPPAVPTGQFGDSKIAITGFSGRFPDAASNDELWELLRSGKDTHRIIPKDRFDWEAHYDPSGATRNTSKVKYGCFVEKPGVFDTRFFRLSPREAEDTDPAQRLALMTTYEALEMSGFVADRTPSSQRDRVGVFYGTTSDDWREVNSGQDVGTYFIPGGNRAFVPGRITFFFRFSGPSISVDTACLSSFAALNVACQSLWQGGCDTAIAGGTNILTNPDNFAGLDRGHFLSTTGNCNPFDDEASGYCRADAVASVILKRLEDAEADNDPIFGVISGVDTNHCGQTVSITRPHEGDQLSLFQRILRRSNTNSLDVSYVEMHGTGTQAGDAAEMRSVLAAMVPGHERTPHHPLHLGAVKANIGHAESASGVSALIKVLMMMQHNEIPPHIGIKNKINRNYPLDLAERNVNIAFKPTPWTRASCPSGKRVSFLNNFSAAGGNTAVLLEDAPERRISVTGNEGRDNHPVVVSGNSPLSLKANITSLLLYLEKHPDTPLPALSYTTTARRTHHKFRASVTGSDIASIQVALTRRLESTEDVTAIPTTERLPRVVFTFTGQGTLYAGLGKQLFETVQSFRQDILRFNRIAHQHGFPSFLPLVTAEPDQLNVAEVAPVIAHLALVSLQMALYRLWVSWGVVPNLAIGHSLGEYPALYAAGVLSASDTIYLVGSRAELLSIHCVRGSHCMVSVKAPLSAVKHTISQSSCDIACVNSPTNTVISGPKEEIDQVIQRLRTKGLECVLLSIPYAFHSAQVENWISEFQSLATKVQYHAPTVPYISPLLKRVVSADEAGVLNGSYLSQACRGTVDFSGAVDAARETGLVNADTNWLELGSHPACSSFVKQTMGSKAITIPSLRQAIDPWATLVPAVQTFFLAGRNIEWNEYYRYFAVAQQVLPLPSYQWDLKNYWIMYRENFCLTKGDKPRVAEKKMIEGAPLPRLSSSVHRVVQEKHAKDKSTLLTESNIHDPHLLPIIQGHKVNGAALCPSSLYADMALTIARYMLQVNNMLPEESALNCANMKVDRPLIASPESSSQLLRVSASADWHLGEISLALFSVNAKSQKIADHANCNVKITRAPSVLWRQDWSGLNHLIQGRISSLRKSVLEGDSHKLKRGLTYKLFGSLVEYANEYQGMQEVILNSEGFEATAKVNFQTGDGGFSWNPCWIDSLGHIAGFIMNGTDNEYSKDYVFVNHGWNGMRCAEKIERNKTYQTYNKMIPQDEQGSMYAGDTYILESGIIIAIFEGVKFQRVPRAVLDRLLPPTKNTKAAAAQPPPQQKKSSPLVKANIEARNSIFVPAKTESSVITGLKAIIAQEAGIAAEDLDPKVPFVDLGIDSLLSITISSRAQEELALDLLSTSFIDFPTLNDLRNHFAPSEDLANHDPNDSVTQSDDDDTSDADDQTDASSIDMKSDVMVTVRATIAEEVGVSLEDLTPTTNLLDLGVDSLMALTIVDKLNQLDLDVPSDLLAECHSLQEVEKTLFPNHTPPEPQSPRPAVIDKSLSRDFITSNTPQGPPFATSIRLQGSAKHAKQILWLFPDGAGSATAYSSLPAISPEILVYGLNCPWMKTPKDLQGPLPRYVSKFIDEIRSKQPTGPYYFGGWSAGGILAWEAAQQLSKQGETTAKLLLLDSPNPVGIEAPPTQMYDFLESLDMFSAGGRKTPEWLRPHFTAFVSILDQYRPVSFPQGKPAPPTYIIYARDGICKSPEDPRPKLPEGAPEYNRDMRWLIDNRTDFAGDGWQDLLGEQRKLQVRVVADANHFTLLKTTESARQVSEFIKQCVLA